MTWLEGQNGSVPFSEKLDGGAGGMFGSTGSGIVSAVFEGTFVTSARAIEVGWLTTSEIGGKGGV